jgi:glycosyltransferase involved in cell wall biosynthesis
MELWPLLRKINLLLRPTKSDGDALSIREALFFRIPVISSDVVPRPEGTIIYKLNSREDLLEKTIYLIEHYKDFVSDLGSNTINFAHKIIEQYETK